MTESKVRVMSMPFFLHEIFDRHYLEWFDKNVQATVKAEIMLYLSKTNCDISKMSFDFMEDKNGIKIIAHNKETFAMLGWSGVARDVKVLFGKEAIQ